MRRDEQGVVLISVILTSVVVSLVIVGALDVVADELRLLRFHADFVRARYAADAGAVVILSVLSGEQQSLIGWGRTIPVGEGRATIRRVAARMETDEYEVIGVAGRGRVLLRLVVDRAPPHRVRVWTVRP